MGVKFSSPSSRVVPRSDLCVVVVTMSEWSNGEGMTPAETSPVVISGVRKS